jgi:hypothetical protein
VSSRKNSGALAGMSSIPSPFRMSCRGELDGRVIDEPVVAPSIVRIPFPVSWLEQGELLVHLVLSGFAGKLGPRIMRSKLKPPPPTAIKAASPPMMATFFINWIACIGCSVTGASQNR